MVILAGCLLTVTALSLLMAGLRSLFEDKLKKISEDSEQDQEAAP